MSYNKEIIENIDNVNLYLEKDEKTRVLREQLAKQLNEYRNTLNYMATDAPLGTLCLPPVIENALLEHGCLRIYDLFDLDFTKVKGLGVRRIGDLTTCLDKFFSML